MQNGNDIDPQDDIDRVHQISALLKAGLNLAGIAHVLEMQTELRAIFRRAGFRRTVQYARLSGVYFAVPAWFTSLVETAFGALSPAARTRFSHNKLLRGLLEIRLVAWK